MARLPTRRMLNLLPTRNAVGNYLHGAVRGLHGWEEPLTANLHRDVVMFCLIAKRAGHAAASGRDLLHTVACWKPQDRQGGRSAHQGLLMAMAMHQQVFGGIGKLQVEFTALVQLVEKLINRADLLGHERCFCAWHKVKVVLTQGENAARSEERRV